MSELVKFGDIECENSCNVSRYRLNEAFKTKIVASEQKARINKSRKYAIYLNQTVDYIGYCYKDEEKREQEVRSLNRVGDSFKKIVVVKDTVIPWHDDNGILYIGIEQFLLDETAMDM